MPIPAKPCNGTFSEETLASLTSNRNREQWMLQTCATCGQTVGAIFDKAGWQPERHWPSVRYTPRTRRLEQRTRTPQSPTNSNPSADTPSAPSA
jgi:hypothetical protein